MPNWRMPWPRLQFVRCRILWSVTFCSCLRHMIPSIVFWVVYNRPCLSGGSRGVSGLSVGTHHKLYYQNTVQKKNDMFNQLVEEKNSEYVMLQEREDTPANLDGTKHDANTVCQHLYVTRFCSNMYWSTPVLWCQNKRARRDSVSSCGSLTGNDPFEHVFMWTEYIHVVTNWDERLRD